MNFTMFLYKNIRKIYRLLINALLCYTITLLKMLGNNVRHGHFHTNGIPIIIVDRRG